MKPPPSKKTRHSGSTSSSLFMDPDVIEIPPPLPRSSRLAKQKQVISHDVIDIIDNEDDSDDLVIIGQSFSKSNKGKTIEAVHDGYGGHKDVSSDGYPSVSHNLVNNNLVGLFSGDYMDVDEYTLLQAHFDNVDIPPGIEAPIPWFQGYDDQGLKETGSTSYYPLSGMQSDTKNSHLTGVSLPSWSLKPDNAEIHGSSVCSSTLQSDAQNSHLTGSSLPSRSLKPANAEIHGSFVNHPSGTGLTSPQLVSQSAPTKKKSAASLRRGRNFNLSVGVESSKPQSVLGPFHRKKKPAIIGSSTNLGFIDNSEAMKLPFAGESPYWGKFNSAKKTIGNSSVYYSNFVGHDGSFHPPGIESGSPWLKNSHNFNPSFANHTANGIYHPFNPLHAPPVHMLGNTQVHNSACNGNNGTVEDSPVATISDAARDEILGKYQSFKQFDTVEDISDHHFISQNSSLKQHPNKWAKKIQDEWKILEKDLPDSIFVRVYESRMDLLRAVIIGAEGTPYHDGLFFFDVFFPSTYPNVPPKVHYHSGGLRLNPNLYHCGKVCLSLLNTWNGSKNEKWVPGVSTILQVLVSIQGLILNTKPYFNEPGYERLSGSEHGESRSLKYNEDTFILSLRTMVYLIRKPPKNFEDFVLGHFCNRANDIMVKCKAYMEGAQVGCLVKGGVQDVDEGDKSCSKQFKDSLTGYVNMLATEFAKLGAKDCGKFQSPATTVNKQLPKAAI
ncbi:hypothetical protein RIF29_39119 [Crotalaria pallida]|uniref:E2 ubiquitin-conjugating enzyme n=1 Tax=Crotalaria pallida TaxID=3830 RepID=A0AAN9E134_CROPI